jgi:hypothetical protein
MSTQVNTQVCSPCHVLPNCFLTLLFRHERRWWFSLHTQLHVDPPLNFPVYNELMTVNLVSLQCTHVVVYRVILAHSLVAHIEFRPLHRKASTADPQQL